MELLIQYHADVNAQDSDGVTPLMRASFGGHVRVAALLLIHGADPSFSDRDGITAISGAHGLRHHEVVELIQCYLHSDC